MLFKDNFYTVIGSSNEDDTHVFSIQINPNHSIFEGHFPDNPVTPGVVQMEIVKELVSQILSKQIALKSMSNCKFLAILNPETDGAVDVCIKLNPTEDNTYRASIIIKNTRDNFLKMSAEYAI